MIGIRYVRLALALLIFFQGPSAGASGFAINLHGALARQDVRFVPEQTHSSLLRTGFGATIGPRFGVVEFQAGALYLPVGYRQAVGGATSDNYSNYIQAHLQARLAVGRVTLGGGAYYGFARDSVSQTRVGTLSISVPSDSSVLRDDRGVVGWLGYQLPLDRWISLRFDGMYQHGLINLARSGPELRTRNIVALVGLGLLF